ncbi:restriction endonuclease subunit S [Vibrio sp. nBUS_14]|uniref:restriction endonuclease subunit S n=1 Tax=Vibrio sp. nBUS_14 TaxID=3395321 RepID=UPI003EBFAF39
MSYKTILGEHLTFKNGKTSPERNDSWCVPVFGSNGQIGFSQESNNPRKTIVIGRVGTYCGSVHFSDDNCWVSDNAIACHAKNPDESHFWKHCLIHLNLNKHRGGSGQPLLNQTTLRSVDVTIPKSQESRIATGQFLELFDNKIANNQAMNQTLEKIAQRIFKSWFIDFDPVKANKEGIPFDGLSPEIQALFPSEFESSELGMIPKGWEVTLLSKVVKLTGGGTPKRSEARYWNGEIPWFSMKDAPERGEVFVIDTEEKITELGLQKSSTKVLPRGTTIITSRGTVGKLALVATDMCMNQSCYGVRGREVGDYFNYFNLKQAILTLKQNVHGAVFDTITTNTFDTYSFAFSGNEIANAYNELITPLLEKSETNARQNKTLVGIRDRLLPKLISGQISVSEAQQELAEAV